MRNAAALRPLSPLVISIFQKYLGMLTPPKVGSLCGDPDGSGRLASSASGPSKTGPFITMPFSSSFNKTSRVKSSRPAHNCLPWLNEKNCGEQLVKWKESSPCSLASATVPPQVASRRRTRLQRTYGLSVSSHSYVVFLLYESY